MADVLSAIRAGAEPALAGRLTSMPVVPEAARHATININAHRRRAADRRHPDAVRRRSLPRRVRSAVPDRRGLRSCESGDRRAREARAVERCRASSYELRDLMVVDPVQTPDDSPVVSAAGAGHRTRARPAGRRWSPVRAPTITSTSRASPASRTASPTARASSSSRISRTSPAGSTTSSTRPRCIALATLDLMGAGR